MATPLSQGTLGQLDQRVARPSYDRGKVTPGILHVGLGNFHRAHQAIYLDDLVGKESASGWGILGAGVMPGDAARIGSIRCPNRMQTATRSGSLE